LINQIWGCSSQLEGISHKKLFNKLSEKIEIKRKNCPEVFHQLETTYVFGWIWESFIGLITFSGEMFTYRLNFNQVGKGHQMDLNEDPRNFDYFTICEDLLRYDKYQKKLTDVKQTIDFEVDSKLFSEFGKEKMFCRNLCEVWIGDKIICYTDSRIVAMSGHVTFQLIVLATIDGNVHFRSSSKGKEIRTIQFNDLIDSILITDNWGFVLLHSYDALYLLNVNGLKIKELKPHDSVMKWTTFSSPYGFDFVAMVQKTGEVTIFEAFYPEKVISNVQSARWDILALRFDSKTERLIIITECGIIHAIPFVFPKPNGLIDEIK